MSLVDGLTLATFEFGPALGGSPPVVLPRWPGAMDGAPYAIVPGRFDCEALSAIVGSTTDGPMVVELCQAVADSPDPIVCARLEIAAAPAGAQFVSRAFEPQRVGPILYVRLVDNGASQGAVGIVLYGTHAGIPQPTT